MKIFETQFEKINQNVNTIKKEIQQQEQNKENSSKDQIHEEEEKGDIINQLDFENAHKIKAIEQE